MNKGPSWFFKLFGIAEPKLYAEVQSNFALNTSSESLYSHANGQAYHVGTFTTPTLAELRVSAHRALECPRSRAIVSEKHQVIVDHLVTEDILLEHSKYPGAVFQAASQFNCLEFSSPSGTPEQGVTGYELDKTQGPSCALACGAGAVVRNYLIPVPSLPSDVVGQRKDHQLNNLDLLEKAINNSEHEFWSIKNGYTFCQSERKLIELEQLISSVPNYNELLGKVKIGIHANVGVNFRTRHELTTESDGVRVTQAYCSAVSCAYSGISTTDRWAPFAKLVLQANYEATLWAAVINTCKYTPKLEHATVLEQRLIDHDSNIRKVQNDIPDDNAYADHVFLTLLGGGVFGNKLEWIADAIGRAIAILQEEDIPIHIHICHYKSISDDVVQLIQESINHYTLR